MPHAHDNDRPAEPAARQPPGRRPQRRHGRAQRPLCRRACRRRMRRAGVRMLVTVMAAGRGAHLRAEKRLSEAAGGRPVVTSVGALVDGVHSLGAQRVALIAPYLPALTTLVIDYLAGHEIEVVDSSSLGVADNCAVGRLDASHMPRLTTSSICAAPMPSCCRRACRCRRSRRSTPPRSEPAYPSCPPRRPPPAACWERSACRPRSPAARFSPSGSAAEQPVDGTGQPRRAAVARLGRVGPGHRPQAGIGAEPAQRLGFPAR